MKRISMILAVSLVAFVPPLAADALTFFVDTWEFKAPDDTDEEAIARHIFLESGVMDVFFDEGHIFFNIYSSSQTEEGLPESGSALDLASQEGADFLVELMTDENGASWTLFDTDDSAEAGRGRLDLEETDATLDPEQRWMALGNALASEILTAVD
jgi:hypothetical protein